MKKVEEVIAFGFKYQSLEFVILTKTKLIECKNIRWKNINVSQYQSSFGSHLKKAKELGKIYEVHSKQAVSTIWKEWFSQKGIKLVEDAL